MSGIIESTFAAAHLAKADLTRALGSKSKTELAAAEKNLGLAEDKVAQLLNKDFDKKADVQEVITFENYDKAAGDKPGSAQWLRFVGCAGASAEVNWSPVKGQVEAQL